MEITFLGTSEAVPTAERSQLAMLLKYKNESILIDCGEGTQRQFKIAKINLFKITRILISHWHGDHVLGLPGLLQTLALNNYSKTLRIYGPKGTKKFMNLLLRTFIFKEKLKTEIYEITKDGVFVDSKDFQIKALKMKHFTPCLAYSFIEKDRRRINTKFIKKIGLKPGPLVGKLQQGKKIKFKGRVIKVKNATYLVRGKKITFIIDTLMNKNCIKLAKDSDLLINEATFLDSTHLNRAKERGHLTAKQAATIAKRAKVKKLIITHLSQRYTKNPEVILKEAKKTFKKTELAKIIHHILV